MSEFNYKDYIANNPLLKEALDFMGTADEETMKYLQEISREELLALEKQFVEMFDTLGEIRYNASDQLSKGASEISQRVHNFITIFRQAIKGYPVVKEGTINERFLDTKEVDEMYEMRDALKKVIQFTQSLKFYGTDEEQKQADKVYGSNGLQKLVRLLTQRIAKKEGDLIDENISSDTKKYMLDNKLDYDKIKALEKQMVEVSRILKDLEKNGGDPLSSKAAKAGSALGEVTYIFRQMLRDVDNDRLDKEFGTGTY